MSQADLVTFKQDTACEFAQLQFVLQKTIDYEAGGLGSPLGGSTAGALLTSLGFLGATLPRQPTGGGPGGQARSEKQAGLAGGGGRIWWCPGMGRRPQRLSWTGKRNRRRLGSGGWILRCCEWSGNRQCSHRTTRWARRGSPLRTDGHVHYRPEGGVRPRPAL